MKRVAFLLGLLSLVSTSAYAWGVMGHQAVGYIAMHFLTPRTLSIVQSSLGPEYDRSLGVAGPWADVVRDTDPSYAWSAPLHFVDAEDNPPTSCSVIESRDCPTNDCILGAIANYTKRIVEPRLDAMQRQEALKFLDHFLGDITQPLHVEAVALGGNTIAAVCNGQSTNLHAVNTGIISDLLIAKYKNSSETWADSLAARIKDGDYRSVASEWIACSSIKAPVHDPNLAKNLTITPLECPLVWARDSNTLDCSTVFDFSVGQDLCTSTYYDRNVPIIETQIAKGGYRLAAWLNVLFDGSTHLPQGSHGGHGHY